MVTNLELLLYIWTINWKTPKISLDSLLEALRSSPMVSFTEYSSQRPPRILVLSLICPWAAAPPSGNSGKMQILSSFSLPHPTESEPVGVGPRNHFNKPPGVWWESPRTTERNRTLEVKWPVFTRKEMVPLSLCHPFSLLNSNDL